MWSLAQHGDAVGGGPLRAARPRPRPPLPLRTAPGQAPRSRRGAGDRGPAHRPGTPRREHRRPGTRPAARSGHDRAARGPARHRARTVARPHRDPLQLRRGCARRAVRGAGSQHQATRLAVDRDPRPDRRRLTPTALGPAAPTWSRRSSTTRTAGTADSRAGARRDRHRGTWGSSGPWPTKTSPASPGDSCLTFT
jgi:hypothetical protein